METMLHMKGETAWSAAEVPTVNSEGASPAAANGCDMPCPACTYYNTCMGPGPHDGVHQCDQGHRW